MVKQEERLWSDCLHGKPGSGKGFSKRSKDKWEAAGIAQGHMFCTPQKLGPWLLCKDDSTLQNCQVQFEVLQISAVIRQPLHTTRFTGCESWDEKYPFTNCGTSRCIQSQNICRGPTICQSILGAEMHDEDNK